MREPRNVIPASLVAFAASALLCGCSRNVTAPNAAPNMTPADNRQAMIEWHRPHDKKPASTAPSAPVNP